MSVRPKEQIVIDQTDVCNHLTFLHPHSQSSYNQANVHIENCATMTTSTSQYHIQSPLQNRYFGLRVETSTFPVRNGDMSAHEGFS